MIYILEFETPLGSTKPRGQARYYMGYCEDGRLEKRLREHRAGRGAAITRAAVNRGIGFSVALTLPGDRNQERKLKARKNHRKIIEKHKGKSK